MQGGSFSRRLSIIKDEIVFYAEQVQQHSLLGKLRDPTQTITLSRLSGRVQVSEYWKHLSDYIILSYYLEVKWGLE